MLWCTKNHLLMLGAIFFELLGDVFSTIIGSKSLQRISRLSFHHGMEFLKILEYLTFCMQQVYSCFGAIYDATLLLSLLLFCTAETLPPVRGDVKERALEQSFILCSFDPQAKQAPVSLQHSPLCLLPQCVQKGETSPLEEPPNALAIDGTGRIVLLPVA